MAEHRLNYERMLRNALRDVVRQALLEVAEQGLPGEHHLYIVFRTDHPGVELPPPLLQQYPEEMTIVLQMQFWDLLVERDSFAITLRFNGMPRRLIVPFEAVIGFADPSVNLALEFDAVLPPGPEGVKADENPFSQARPPASSEAALSDGSAPDTDGDDPGEQTGGKVVDFRSYRKK